MPSFLDKRIRMTLARVCRSSVATKGLVVLAVLLTPAASATGRQQAHDMGGGTLEDGKVVWRMPPMDMKMPMVPGLENQIPAAEPFLPAGGMDPSMFPEAAPQEIYDLADGDEIDLEARLVRHTINGKAIVAYGYNGQIPGPLLRATRGSTVTVHFTNNAEMPSTIRWHGVRLDNDFDGTPTITQPPVPQGESFTYEVRFDDVGLYWYHPQVRLDIQQDLGLYGPVLVQPAADDYYNPVNREEVLILDDMLVDDAGPIPWGADVPTHALMGRFGNVMLANGSSDYRLSVKRGEVVRFYLANVSSARTFNVVFGGAPIKLIAADMGKFEREQWVQSVVITPAERYTVEVRFEAPGKVEITNTIQAIDHFRGEFYRRVDVLGTVSVETEPVSDDLAAGFDSLHDSPEVQQDIDDFRAYLDAPPDHQLELQLRVNDLPLPIVMSMEFEKGIYSPPVEWNDTMPMMNWLATGAQVYWILRDPATGKENMEIYWDFDVGEVAKIRIFNDPEALHPMNHPLHLHGQRFLVLEMDGVRNPNLVWKDTVLVPVASTIDLLVDMSNVGEWVLHCHIAEHLHAGMMMAFGVWEAEVDGQGR